MVRCPNVIPILTGRGHVMACDFLSDIMPVAWPHRVWPDESKIRWCADHRGRSSQSIPFPTLAWWRETPVSRWRSGTWPSPTLIDCTRDGLACGRVGGHCRSRHRSSAIGQTSAVRDDGRSWSAVGAETLFSQDSGRCVFERQNFPFPYYTGWDPSPGLGLSPTWSSVIGIHS